MLVPFGVTTVTSTVVPAVPAGAEGSDYFGPVLETVPTRRVPVTRWLETSERGRAAPTGHGDAIVGTLVHRLLQGLPELPAA